MDVTREALQQVAYTLYEQLVSAYHIKSVANFSSTGDKLLTLYDDMDSLLSSNEHFLLGKWLKNARALGTTEVEKNRYEYNARNQITLWGPDGQIHDYANKQWGGLMKSFYKLRWELFISQVLGTLKSGKKFDNSKFQLDVFNQESSWMSRGDKFPHKPVGDSVYIVKYLHDTYRQQKQPLNM